MLEIDAPPKKITSPFFMLLYETVVPYKACEAAKCGRFIPTCANESITRPEQSVAPNCEPPHTYAPPTMLLAYETTVSILELLELSGLGAGAAVVVVVVFLLVSGFGLAVSCGVVVV